MASLAGRGLINTHPFHHDEEPYETMMCTWEINRSLLPQAYLILTNLLKNLMFKNIPLLHLIRKQCKVTLLFKLLPLLFIIQRTSLQFLSTSRNNFSSFLTSVTLPFISHHSLSIYYMPDIIGLRDIEQDRHGLCAIEFHAKGTKEKMKKVNTINNAR